MSVQSHFGHHVQFKKFQRNGSFKIRNVSVYSLSGREFVLDRATVALEIMRQAIIDEVYDGSIPRGSGMTKKGYIATGGLYDALDFKIVGDTFYLYFNAEILNLTQDRPRLVHGLPESKSSFRSAYAQESYNSARVIPYVVNYGIENPASDALGYWSSHTGTHFWEKGIAKIQARFAKDRALLRAKAKINIK